MGRIVKREIIDTWIKQAGANAVARLSHESQVSTTVIAEARVGRVPKKAITRQLLCRVLGVSEDVLFPFADPSPDESSEDEAG